MGGKRANHYTTMTHDKAGLHTTSIYVQCYPKLRVTRGVYCGGYIGTIFISMPSYALCTPLWQDCEGVPLQAMVFPPFLEHIVKQQTRGYQRESILREKSQKIKKFLMLL